MNSIEIIFWICIFIVFYTYVGYGVLLWVLLSLKKWISSGNEVISEQYEYPALTILIAAYNEVDYIEEKIENTLALDYPTEKLQFLFVTDGSDDGTARVVEKFSQIVHFHLPERQGKIAAVNRVMPYVQTPIVVYSDANTLLPKDALFKIVQHYKDKKVGGVSGEKRIRNKENDNASGAGEGIYWKYESLLKKMDSDLYSVVGAAGELFSIRTGLYEEVPKDTIIEDFYLTLGIAAKGYRIVYEPDAYALESPSANVKEELKRKVRIAAGGIQAIVRLSTLLNIFKHGILSFQYISHRVLRWTITPFALLFLFIANAILAYNGILFYQFVFVLQVLFYGLVAIGFILKNRDIKLKFIFVPYYFFIMNYAVFAGIIRYLKKEQTVTWERAKRAS